MCIKISKLNKKKREDHALLTCRTVLVRLSLDAFVDLGLVDDRYRVFAVVASQLVDDPYLIGHHNMH